MAKKTLSCTLPDGTKAARKTENEYKYVVIGRLDIAKRRAGREETARRMAGLNFNYLKKCARGDGGNFGLTPTQAIEALGSADATRESYAAKLLAEYRAADTEKWGDADKGPWEAITWSTKEHLARARMTTEGSRRYYTDLQVVPVSE